MAENLNLAINISGTAETSELTALLGILQSLGIDVSQLEPKVNELSSELDTLGRQQKLVESFRALQDTVTTTQKSIDNAKDKLRGLTVELVATESPSKTLIESFRQATQEVSQLEKALAKQQTQLSAVESKFSSAGLEAKNLSAAQAKITESSERLAAELGTVKTRFEAIAKSAVEQQAVDNALKTLKIDAAELSTGIIKAERDVLTAFGAIANSAKSTEEQLRQALIVTFQEIQSPPGLEALKQDLEDVVASGRLTEEQINGLRTTVAKPLPDPTGGLRTGVHSTRDALGELKEMVVGFLALDAFRSFVTNTIDQSRQAQSAFKGLESVAEGTGVGIGKAYSEATNLASKGILTLTEASEALQNLLSRGYSVDQAVQTINRLTDSAAFGRRAHLQWGEAIVSATEGLRQENPQLVDNANVTKNVSVIWKEYADLIGKSVEDLTKQEKIQAEVNGILKETSLQAGNAEKATAGLEGQLVRLNKAITEAQIKIGTELTPALADAASGLSTMASYIIPAIGLWDKFVVTMAFSVDKLLAIKDGIVNLESPLARIDQLTTAYNDTLADIDRRFGLNTESVKENTVAVIEQGGAQKSAAAEAAAAARVQEQAAEDVQLALKALEVSISDVNTGMTKTERDAIASLTTIAQSSETTGATLSASLLSALQKVESAVGLVKFREQLDAIVVSGKLTAGELENFTRLQGVVNETIGKGAYSLDSFRDGLDNLKGSFTNSVVASDQFGQSLKMLGLDAEQVVSGMDADFKIIIKTLQELADSGRLTGDILREALQNAIKTADSQVELKALSELIIKLGKDGKLAGGEMTLALDAVKTKLLEIAAATDPVAQAFARLGITSATALKQAAQEAQDAFNIIKTSATATAGDVNAAFAAMAAKVLEAGDAAGPVGLAMAEASLRAKAATEEQQQALEALIAKYEDSGTAATSAAVEQVQAAHTAAAAIEDYAARVEARAGAGANAFRETTTAIQQTTAAAQTLSNSQQRQIQGYDDLSVAGKAWADSLIRQAMAADAAQAGMQTYRDATGKTISEIQRQIEAENEAADAAEQLGVQYDNGAISAQQYEFALRQLVLQMETRVTAAGDEVAQKLMELQQQMQEARDTVNAGVGGSTGAPAPILNTTGIDNLTIGLKTVSTLLSEINTKAGVVGENIAKQVTSSSYMVQAVVKELQLQAGRAN